MFENFKDQGIAVGAQPYRHWDWKKSKNEDAIELYTDYENVVGKVSFVKEGSYIGHVATWNKKPVDSKEFSLFTIQTRGCVNVTFSTAEDAMYAVEEKAYESHIERLQFNVGTLYKQLKELDGLVQAGVVHV